MLKLFDLHVLSGVRSGMSGADIDTVADIIASGLQGKFLLMFITDAPICMNPNLCISLFKTQR